jgi:hypothetical protein
MELYESGLAHGPEKIRSLTTDAQKQTFAQWLICPINNTKIL